MPELPDLQVFSANLHKMLKGKKVKKVNITVAKKLKSPAATIKKSLEGAKLKKVYREGKELRFAFNNDARLGMHLMLHGSLNLFDKKNGEKHAIFELVFDDDSGLALSDWQKQASVSLNPEEARVPDALSKEMNLKFLKQALDKKRNVKTVLMDQHVIRGIGNAYADEILWDAGISPFSAANKIPAEKIKALAKSIKKVLKDAEKKIKKAHPDLVSGEVRDFLLIHNSKKEKSPTGVPIESATINNRKTYYTKEQELYQ
jgi:formamidopyrimidine-DNA glycosylase